jgi:hypothetical protein
VARLQRQQPFLPGAVAVQHLAVAFVDHVFRGSFLTMSVWQLTAAIIALRHTMQQHSHFTAALDGALVQSTAVGCNDVRQWPVSACAHLRGSRRR